MNESSERWLSVDEIAAYLGVKRDTIYKWIDRRSMPAHKVGRLWKFKASQIDEWVHAGKAGDGIEEAEATVGNIVTVSVDGQVRSRRRSADPDVATPQR